MKVELPPPDEDGMISVGEPIPVIKGYEPLTPDGVLVIVWESGNTAVLRIPEELRQDRMTEFHISPRSKLEMKVERTFAECFSGKSEPTGWALALEALAIEQGQPAK